MADATFDGSCSSQRRPLWLVTEVGRAVAGADLDDDDDSILLLLSIMALVVLHGRGSKQTNE